LPTVDRIILFDFDSDRISVKLSVRQLLGAGSRPVADPCQRQDGFIHIYRGPIRSRNVGSLTKSEFRSSDGAGRVRGIKEAWKSIPSSCFAFAVAAAALSENRI